MGGTFFGGSSMNDSIADIKLDSFGHVFIANASLRSHP